ncbi:MAG: SIS domain-containing protein [Treponema sp.]|jgi:D-sedoheptulose 7-phosphate isomerase|nr:SIS domain-containing protein [Treponema sp.]
METGKYGKKLKEYTDMLFRDALQSDFNKLGEIAAMLLDAKAGKKRIYIAGNGGSAATASHMANDLIKGCRVGKSTGLRALALTDPLPVITCLANDFSYDDIFSIQLETQADEGDLFVVYSGSGNSLNIVKAVETAKRIGLKTIAFTGGNGGKLKSLCDTVIIAPSPVMEQIEDIHMFYEHALVTLIREELSVTA